MFFITIKGQ